jgi:putative ABC transport system permease protein
MRQLGQGPRRLSGEVAEGLRIALGSLLGARLRSFLTTLGIVIGVMTVIAIVAIIQGLDAAFEEQIANLGTHTVYVSKYAWFIKGQGEWWEMRNRKDLGRRELEAVEREATLATAISPQVNWRGTVTRADHELQAVRLTGTDARYLDTSGGTVAAGRFLNEPDVDLARPSIVLGFEVGQRLFPGWEPEAMLGKRVRVEGHLFTVVGTMARRGKLLGMDLDTIVLLPHTTFVQALGGKRTITLAVTTTPEHLEELQDQLTGILRRVRQVPPDRRDDFALNRQEQFLKLYRQLTGALYAVAVGVGVITLVVGGIGIMNIMLVTVTERTREIGVRMAIGASRREVLMQFLLEAVLLSIGGGLVGILFGIAGPLAVNFFVEGIHIPISMLSIVIAFAVSFAVGLVFGLLPANRAARLNPTEALRYE